MAKHLAKCNSADCTQSMFPLCNLCCIGHTFSSFHMNRNMGFSGNRILLRLLGPLFSLPLRKTIDQLLCEIKPKINLFLLSLTKSCAMKLLQNKPVKNGYVQKKKKLNVVVPPAIRVTCEIKRMKLIGSVNAPHVRGANISTTRGFSISKLHQCSSFVLVQEIVKMNICFYQEMVLPFS